MGISQKHKKDNISVSGFTSADSLPVLCVFLISLQPLVIKQYFIDFVSVRALLIPHIPVSC